MKIRRTGAIGSRDSSGSGVSKDKPPWEVREHDPFYVSLRHVAGKGHLCREKSGAPDRLSEAGAVVVFSELLAAIRQGIEKQEAEQMKS